MRFVGMAHLRDARSPRSRLGLAIVVAMLSAQGLACVAADDSENAAGDSPRKRNPRLHIATFSDMYDPRLMLPMVSAYANGLSPMILGLGEPIGWEAGMGRVWNSYRNFVWNKTEPEDVVLLFDAYDVMFQAGEAELLQMYHDVVARTGREIIYNADLFCSSSRKVDYPACTTPWCYLNCCIIIVRSSALRKLFKETLPPDIKDKDGKPKRLQNYHTDFFLDHQDVAMIDAGCELTQTVFEIPGIGIELTTQMNGIPDTAKQLVMSGGRLHNKFTNTTPLILHFPGPGHWPSMGNPVRTGTCYAYEFLRYTQPDLLALMEKRGAGRYPGQYHAAQPWKPICTYYLSPLDLLGSWIAQHGDYIVWFYETQTWAIVPLLLLVLLSLWQGRRVLRAVCMRAGGCQDTVNVEEYPKDV
mmetsp:Transcript_107239/g.346330  ORF Transcript_107239/g.346330 Transcript_107239/m.346330 type:complete len:414 (+) Transcript_107239:24-1265(+)